MPFENIVGKEGNAGNQHFLLFPQCFLPIPKRSSVFTLHLSFANAVSLDQSKILSYGKDLTYIPEFKQTREGKLLKTMWRKKEKSW